jgi:hypothetical protein
MRCSFVHLVNAGLLIVVFIGFPAITGRNFASIRFSDPALAYELTVGGLVLGVVLNLALVVWLARTRKERGLCLGWTALFGLFLAVVVGQAQGHVDFGWLQRWLRGARGWF